MNCLAPLGSYFTRRQLSLGVRRHPPLRGILAVIATKVLTVAVGLSAVAIGSQAQSLQRDLPASFRSMAGVTLNRDSAASIRRKLGLSAERKIGADHDTFTSWCYLTREDSSPVILELMSDASDMGTPGRALNVIRLRTAASQEDRHGCVILRTPMTLSTPSGLRLGLTARSIQRLLGRPTRTSGDSLVYEFEAREYMRRGSPEFRAWNTPARRKSCFAGGPPYSNIGTTVMLRLLDDRVTEIRLARYDQATC